MANSTTHNVYTQYAAPTTYIHSIHSEIVACFKYCVVGNFHCCKLSHTNVYSHSLDWGDCSFLFRMMLYNNYEKYES